MRGAPIEVLERVPLFSGLNNRELQKVARLFKKRHFSKGATVVKEGSGGAAFFVIESGEATVFIGGKQHTTLKPGEYFGEIALIDEGTRMATITASSDLFLLRAYLLGLPPVRGEEWCDRLEAAAADGKVAARDSTRGP